MKGINIASIIEAHESLEKANFLKYLDHFKVSIKEDELLDLAILKKNLQKEAQCTHYFNDFFIGYKIPQISKEFDLLRLGENYNLNIELKKTSTVEKIKKQLIKNKYYLSFLGLNTICFTFITNDLKILKLDNNDDLVQTNLKELLKVIQKQKIKEVANIDSLFNPSNYLVSPFNSTKAFVSGEYFLTNHQDEIKKKVLAEINRDKTSFISIIGESGTGKTLLIYDIVDECRDQNLNTLIIHCGNLNEGQHELIYVHGWNIIPAKDIDNQKISNYSVVVIDEVQRIYVDQLNHIISEVRSSQLTCLFSYDKRQCLHRFEIENNIDGKIDNEVKPVKYELTKKIRTNKEIASFIECILDINKYVDRRSKPNITLNYFKSNEAAKEYIEHLINGNWKMINYTPSLKYNYPYDSFKIEGQESAHKVIGQEYDDVIAVVDSHFYYNNEGSLSTRGYKRSPYYHPTKMLLQMMTRARRKLNFVVIDNEIVLKRCLEILNPK